MRHKRRHPTIYRYCYEDVFMCVYACVRLLWLITYGNKVLLLLPVIHSFMFAKPFFRLYAVSRVLNLAVDRSMNVVMRTLLILPVSVQFLCHFG